MSINVSLKQEFSIFKALVTTQLHTVVQQLKDMVINLYIWAFCILIIMGYIMQSFGLAADYGCFQLASIVGTAGLFEIYGNVMRNVMDFEGDKTISYYLTLPVKAGVVFASFVMFYAVIGIFLSCIILPFGKLLLYNSFDLSRVAVVKTVIMIFVANLFFGVFTLLITAYVGTMAKMRNIWSRFIFPLWFMGCYQFSWESVYQISAPLSYVMLLNPLVYIMEGFRASLLGQAGSLPWELCCAVLILFTGVSWVASMAKMRRVLDFV